MEEMVAIVLGTSVSSSLLVWLFAGKQIRTLWHRVRMELGAARRVLRALMRR